MTVSTRIGRGLAAAAAAALLLTACSSNSDSGSSSKSESSAGGQGIVTAWSSEPQNPLVAQRHARSQAPWKPSSHTSLPRETRRVPGSCGVDVAVVAVPSTSGHK